MVPIWDFMVGLIQFEGGRYVFGAENDTLVKRVLAGAERIIGPSSRTDCSEVIQSASALCGLKPPMPDGSWIQWQHCRNHNTLIPIRSAMGSYGRLLFRFTGDPASKSRPQSAHVAVSLGDGTTFEARGSRFTVGIHPVTARGWTHAAEIPGIDYSVFPLNNWMGDR